MRPLLFPGIVGCGKRRKLGLVRPSLGSTGRVLEYGRFDGLVFAYIDSTNRHPVIATKGYDMSRLMWQHPGSQRGQALVEFALLAPFLLTGVLFGSIALGTIMLYGTQREMAFHTMGNILNEPNPATDFNTSLIYNNLGATNQVGSMWPDSYNPRPLLNGEDSTGSRTTLTIGGVTMNNLFVATPKNMPAITPVVTVQQFPPPSGNIKGWIGSPIFLIGTTTTLAPQATLVSQTLAKTSDAYGNMNTAASRTTFRPAGIQTMMHCYTDIQTTINLTMNPGLDVSAVGAPPPAVPGGRWPTTPLATQPIDPIANTCTP